MRDMKIAFSGDQLTCVRFAGAKICCLVLTQQLIVLNIALALQTGDVAYQSFPFTVFLLLSSQAESVNQVGTLKYFREKYNGRNATPSKVLDSFEGSEELFLTVGKASIVTTALNIFGMLDLEERPSLHTFPENIACETFENKNYFNDAFGKFIDKFLLQKVDINDCWNDDDFVKNYALCFIFLAILVKQMKDTEAEGDGSRNLINQKLLLSVFKSMGAYSKNAIEMFASIAQIKCF